jgi:hypothetical protein
MPGCRSACRAAIDGRAIVTNYRESLLLGIRMVGRVLVTKRWRSSPVASTSFGRVGV